jgi:hypothetical protein
LRAVLANDVHRTAAARTGGVFGLDDHFDPRQMIRQRTATGAPLFGPRAPQRRIGPLLIGLLGGERLLEILQPEIELVGIELLGTLAELNSLKLADQVAQAIVLTSQPGFSARSASRSAHAFRNRARSAATSSGRASAAVFMVPIRS